MDAETIDMLLAEHRNINIPSKTHLHRMSLLATQLKEHSVASRDDIDTITSLWIQMAETMKDLGSDLERQGLFDLKVLTLIGKEKKELP